VVAGAYLGGEVAGIIALSARGRECIEMFADFISVVGYQRQMLVCGLAHVLKYVMANCVCKDQVTVKW
jgi:hypothetical protein